MMKVISWDEEKNALLREEREVSFEQVLIAIEEGKLLDILDHTNKKYAHQQILVVEIDCYAYLVPFVETEKELFLKTIIPSRKATKQYIVTNISNKKL
jgi:uncharacterized DUF497 family protein